VSGVTPAGRWRRPVVALAALLSIALTFNLGLWQLRRAEQKIMMQSAVDSRGAMPPLVGAGLARPLDPQALMHRRLVLHGTWLHQHTVFLDNRPMNARTGFHVLTPLRLEPGGDVIVVQRGWVPRDFQDRSRLPVLPLADGVVRVEGRMAPPPARLYEFAGTETGSIRQNLDLPSFAAETGLALVPASVLQAGPSGDGLLRDWPPFQAGVEKHHGYAFQWFALSGLIALLYVWFQIIQPIRTRS
jgi:surfeit locus 1 family protein